MDKIDILTIILIVITTVLIMIFIMNYIYVPKLNDAYIYGHMKGRENGYLSGLENGKWQVDKLCIERNITNYIFINNP